MTAVSGYDLDVGGRPLAQVRTGPLAAVPEPATVLVTVQISVAGENPPPAVAGLLDTLRALAALGVTTAVTTVGAPGDPQPAPSARPRLVRELPDQFHRPPAAPAGGGPELLLHPASRSLYRDGAAVRLTRREFDLFAFLCEHPRRVFTRTQLLHRVWGYESASGERTVDVHVRRLRDKVAGGRFPVVATVRGVGYRLAENARVTLADIDG